MPTPPAPHSCNVVEFVSEDNVLCNYVTVCNSINIVADIEVQSCMRDSCTRENIKGKEPRLELIGFHFVLTHYEYISWVNL